MNAYGSVTSLREVVFELRVWRLLVGCQHDAVLRLRALHGSSSCSDSDGISSGSEQAELMWNVCLYDAKFVTCHLFLLCDFLFFASAKIKF